MKTEAQNTAESSVGKGGGWMTFPFLIGSAGLLSVGGLGWLANIIVYLIEEYKMESIDAAQISNVVAGSLYFVPIVVAIIADSFLGSLSVATITAYASIFGTVVLTLTATVGSLRPRACSASDCPGASGFQLAVLYAGIALSTIGLGGFRYTAATMGADQFDDLQLQDTFFNWFFFSVFAASVVGTTAIVVIQNSVSWALGFGLCAAFCFAGLLVFLSGQRFYRRKGKPQGGPLTALARVVVAALRKRNIALSSNLEDYHYDSPITTAPPNTFRFLNRAAQIVEGDVNLDGTVAKPWRVCTVQEVEDLKTVVRMLPLWSSGILVSTPIAIHFSFSVLQAMTMERPAGPNFRVPAASVLAISLLASAVAVPFIDRLLHPTWHKITGRVLTPLHRIGVAHVLNIISMVTSAVVEAKRLEIHGRHPADAVVRMSMFWLCPQLVLVGFGEAFNVGTVILLYQEFPPTLRNMATGIAAIILGIAFYASAALIDLIRRVTGWLPNDINQGRIDNAYWVIAAVGLLNFGYFLVCATLYKYQNVNVVVVVVDDDQKGEDNS